MSFRNPLDSKCFEQLSQPKLVLIKLMDLALFLKIKPFLTDGVDISLTMNFKRTSNSINSRKLHIRIFKSARGNYGTFFFMTKIYRDVCAHLNGVLKCSF